MSRHLSKLETAILWLALKHRKDGRAPAAECDVTADEVREKYLGLHFKGGCEKFGNSYLETSLPNDPILATREVRGTVALWRAMCRLDDRGLLVSLWRGLGTSIWCVGGNLTDEGFKLEGSLPERMPTKVKWGSGGKPRVDPNRALDELEQQVLRMALRNHVNAPQKEPPEVDLLEWEVLATHFGFPMSSGKGGVEGQQARGLNAFDPRDRESERFLAARHSISQACRFLHDRGLIQMGGPGAPSEPAWPNYIRGWGWSQAEASDVLQSLFPYGHWDTVSLTPDGVLQARLLPEIG